MDESQPSISHEEASTEDVDYDCDLFSKARDLIDKITSSHDNPNPNVLHALSSILEAEESRYLEGTRHSSLNNGRAFHNSGRLANLVRENDEFFELISSTFLSETRYSIAIQAASARLLLSCSLTSMYPTVFEDTVLDKIKNWVMDETIFSSAAYNLRYDSTEEKSSDSEMLKTYSTGLLAQCLAGGASVVEDALVSGLSAQLMRYLNSILGETMITQRDTNYKGGIKNTLSVNSSKGKDECRTSIRQDVETILLEDSRIPTDESVANQSFKMDHDRGFVRHVNGEDVYDINADEEDRWYGKDLCGGHLHLGDLYTDVRDDSRCRAIRGLARSNSKVSEGVVVNAQTLNLSGNHLCNDRITRDRNQLKTLDVKKIPDARKCLGGSYADRSAVEKGICDDFFQEFKVGTKDISNLIKEAVQAAETESRATGAPLEAVRAAGGAAAELVKSAALEEFQNTNDEDAASSAASRAASTVIGAATAVEVSRNSYKITTDSITLKAIKPEISEEIQDFILPDMDSLAQLREKYCIQCLEILGEYVEVLGPVLHERGVDVCLELLQRSCTPHDTSKVVMILPDVLKLICALAAHKKFAAVFVDRDGIQKLLAVPRVSQTFIGLSSCLFTISSLQGIMERVCTLPSDVLHGVIELALKLLDCPLDQARKNAALFFAAAFIFRAVIDTFDAHDGLLKLLGVLHNAASVRSGMVGLSNSGSLRDRSPDEVFTSLEKQVVFHTCVALRQYFRAHLLLLVDFIRPNKNSRNTYRNIPSTRVAYKPLDISSEAIDAIFLQLQKDRKLGSAFVRARWPAVDKFLALNGHCTMLELCQAPPVERYLHDLLQYALGILHIVTLVHSSRRLIVNCTLSNDRVGIAVILDVANCTGCIEPDIIQPALNVLINLVCPPPSISNKPSSVAHSQQAVTAQNSNHLIIETRDRNVDRNVERNVPDRVVSMTSQSAPREHNGESSLIGRGSIAVIGQPCISSVSQTHLPTVTSGLVGDHRISLGAAAGSSGFASQLEQGYRQAREAVRTNNGIKVLLHLLQPRIVSPPARLDCLRALACRVLLGLARDHTIAHILTKLQVGKRLSELIRDSGNLTSGSEQDRWQAELAQVAIELIAIVTNSGRASTLVASDAATPTFRRIERAAIAAATPITYHSRELLLLMHEHLWGSGLVTTAATLLKEAQLTPLTSLTVLSSLTHQSPSQDNFPLQLQWPSGRIPSGFLSNQLKSNFPNENSSLMECNSRNKTPVFSANLSFQFRNLSHQSHEPDATAFCEVPGSNKVSSEILPVSQCKTHIVLPMKRKFTELKDAGSPSSVKRHDTSDYGFGSPFSLVPNTVRKISIASDAAGFSSLKEQCGRSMPGIVTDSSDDNPHSINTERLTLDSLVVQYLKHQHRQCTAPITTLPPISLLHPHLCPYPKRSLDAPSNATSRLSRREFKGMHGGMHGHRKDRQLVYSRFRPWRTCRDDATLFTCITFLKNSSHIAVGNYSGELKIFDSDSGVALENCTSHQSALTHVQSCLINETQLLLSSSSHDVRLWDASSVSSGPLHSLQVCKSARFSNSGIIFAALTVEQPLQKILVYDVDTFQLKSKLSNASSSVSGSVRGHTHSNVHFSPSDERLLWNGVLWDPRISQPVHQFDQFTDYGGGGFHPSGNEVIINSEVWDLRKFRLLRTVPSLDQTVMTFNAGGDIIYAILRRNLEDITSAVNTRRVKHPLFSAFRTMDAVNYSEISTTSVDRCVLDFASEPTDSFVGLVTMDDQQEMFSSARVYEIGRRRPTDDDSDPDDAETDEEEDTELDGDEDPILGSDFELDSSDDDTSNDDSGVSEFEGVVNGGGMLEIVGGSDEYEDSEIESLSSNDDEIGDANFTF